jgi:hypothetical protein
MLAGGTICHVPVVVLVLTWQILLCVLLLDALPDQEQSAALRGLVDAAWEAGEPLLALDLIRRGGTWVPGRELSKWRETPLWQQYMNGAVVRTIECMPFSYTRVRIVALSLCNVQLQLHTHEKLPVYQLSMRLSACRGQSMLTTLVVLTHVLCPCRCWLISGCSALRLCMAQACVMQQQQQQQ